MADDVVGSVQSAWEFFAEAAIPAAASAAQRHDMRLAFHGGAWFLVEIMGRLALAGLSPADQAVIVARLRAEVGPVAEALGLVCGRGEPSGGGMPIV